MTLTLDTNLKQQLKGVLLGHQGRSQAIKAGELAELLSIDERRVRLAIRELRKELPILSATESPAGYFMAETIAEFETFKQVTRSRLIEDAVMLRDVRLSFHRSYENVKQARLI